MVTIFISSSVPVTETTISVAAGGLEAPASNFARIEFYCNNGASVRVPKEDNGGTINNYRSPVATFFGLTPGASYSFRVEVQLFSTRDPEHAGPINQSTLTPSISIGAVTGLSAYNIIQNAFSITWNAASGANGYQIFRRVQGTTDWNISYENSTAYRFTGLPSETYYEVKVRGYTGNVYGTESSIITVRTQAAVPSKLNWPVRTSGNDFNLTAKEWNDLTSKINAWRVYKGSATYSFAVAYTGNFLTAAIFNQAVVTLNALQPSITPPQQVVTGNIVTAAKINALGNAIDSL